MSKQNELAQLADAVTVDGSNVGIVKSQNSEINLEVTNTNTGSDAQVRTKYTTDGGLFTVGKTSDAHSFAGDAYIYNVDNTNIRFATSDTERMRIDSSGNVGIGTSSPTAYTGYSTIGLNGTNGGVLEFKKGNTQVSRISNAGETALQFATNNAERMRIDSSGRLLVDTTNISATAQQGNSMTYDNGRLEVQKYREPALKVGNYTDGFGTYSSNCVEFYSGGSLVGSIGIIGGAKEVSISANHLNGSGLYFSSGNNILPMKDGGLSDNTQDIGKPSIRFDDIYATNGTIQTSDFNEKQDIASLTATEMLVGKRISALFKTFRWKDSVAEKGDNARTHTGVIAQDVQAAFTAEGLDAGDYALFISTTWWETQTEVPAVEAVEAVTETTTDEDGNEVVTVITEAVEAVDAYTRTDTYDTEAEAPEGATERTRLGIRYPELLSFVAAYNEQRFASIEARLTALEDV